MTTNPPEPPNPDEDDELETCERCGETVDPDDLVTVTVGRGTVWADEYPMHRECAS